MPLSIFIDALPYTEVKEHYSKWFINQQTAELQPNIAYSSVLHWQLYCNKYPDDRLKFVDWQKTPETRKSIRIISCLLRPFDCIRPLSFLNRKVLDRLFFHGNCFANIPMKFRKDFSEQSQYLFWNREVYSKEKLFEKYCVVSQDEGNFSFDETIQKLNNAIESNQKNLFLCIGEIDHQGHLCARGSLYSEIVAKFMAIIRDSIEKYLNRFPEEEVLIVSDHGMSTINNYVDLKLEKKFGAQSWNNYVAYQDSCLMCVWCSDKHKIEDIAEYLKTKEDIGHLLSNGEREYYRTTNPLFGDLIFNLREGNCFKTSWFGNSIKKHPNGQGMHGFWPDRKAKDQMAAIILINGKHSLAPFYTYFDAYNFIKMVMLHE